MTVSFVDQVGVVTDVVPMETIRGRSGGVRAHPEDPQKLRVQWFGGFCDRTAVFELRPREDGYSLLLTIQAVTDCDAVLAPAQRGVVLTLNRHIDAETVELLLVGVADGQP
jgi:hypothetical protein